MATHKRNHVFAVCFYLSVVIAVAEAAVMGVLRFLPELGYWDMVVDPAMLGLVGAHNLPARPASDEAHSQQGYPRRRNGSGPLTRFQADRVDRHGPPHHPYEPGHGGAAGMHTRAGGGCHCYEAVHGCPRPRFLPACEAAGQWEGAARGTRG